MQILVIKGKDKTDVNDIQWISEKGVHGYW
jgi:hypothetical protein